MHVETSSGSTDLAEGVPLAKAISPVALAQHGFLVSSGVILKDEGYNITRWNKHKQKEKTGNITGDFKEQTSDALDAALCAADYNLRWLLRTIVRLDLRSAFFILALLHWLPNVTLKPPPPRQNDF